MADEKEKEKVPVTEVLEEDDEFEVSYSSVSFSVVFNLIRKACTKCIVDSGHVFLGKHREHGG